MVYELYWILLWVAFGSGLIFGIILHEFGHKVFCDIFKIKVNKIQYFRFNPKKRHPYYGFIIHEDTKNKLKFFLIGLAPIFTVGIFLLMLFIFSFYLKPQFRLLLQFTGFGMFFPLFPSEGDIDDLFSILNKRNRISHKILYIFLKILKILANLWIRIILVLIIANYILHGLIIQLLLN